MAASVSLNVTIVGAGIAGLATAIALKRAGHKVKIFEKSTFSGDVGFAVSIAPNGTKVLSSFGFDYARAQAVEYERVLTGKQVELVNGRTLETLVQVDLAEQREKWGERWVVLFRPDLHAELMRLVFENSHGTRVPELVLGARVVHVDIESATITLEDGSSHTSDLIVGADGERSVVKTAEGFKGTSVLRKSPVSIFRCMVPTRDLEEDETLRSHLQTTKGCLTAFTDGKRVMTWWACREYAETDDSGILQDLEAGYPTTDAAGSFKVFNENELQSGLLQEYWSWHPTIQRALSKAMKPSNWDINFTSPPFCWTKSKAVLIGDAVHSMFPTTGQGACQSLEDAAALGILLSELRYETDLTTRLQMFQRLRNERVMAVHAMSSVMVGQETRMNEKLAKSLPGGKLFSGHMEHLDFTNTYVLDPSE